MTCHPSPTPSGHRSHFPFTASAACSAPCPLPPAPLLRVRTSRSSFKRSPPGAFPMTAPKTPLAQHPQSPFLHYHRPHALGITWGLQAGTAVPTRVQELREHRFWLFCPRA